MTKKKLYEAYYAGYVYEKPVTHWTSSEEVKKRLVHLELTSGKAIKAGGMPIISDGKNVFIDAKDGHTAIIASSGMKKSVCCFMPLIHMLAQANENMIVTDPKGELFDRTANFLKSHGYNVPCLDFRTMDKDCFNILRYLAMVYRNGDTDKGLALLSDIVNTLAEPQRNHAKDPFWPDMAALWMNATGALMLDAFPKIDQVNILNWSDFNVRSSAAAIEEDLLPLMPDNTVKSALKQCLTSAENTFKSILVSASSLLTMFNQNPKLAAMLSHSTFTLDELTKPKTALYIITDDTTSTADPILGMIIRQIQSYLIDRAYHSKNGKLDVRMNFVLDEFASIPISDMDKALATHRSRNIRYYLCIQSLALLKERYNNAEKLLSNCTSTLYLGSTELELLNDLEAKLGNTCITPDGREKPLCSVSELMTLEKAWDHKEAIYMNLSEGIRYCTMLPSIEAYETDDYPALTYHMEPPEIEMYTVYQFLKDIENDKIHVPFCEKKSASGKRICEMGLSEELAAYIDENIDDIIAKFDDLFGTSDED